MMRKIKVLRPCAECGRTIDYSVEDAHEFPLFPEFVFCRPCYDKAKHVVRREERETGTGTRTRREAVPQPDGSTKYYDVTETVRVFDVVEVNELTVRGKTYRRERVVGRSEKVSEDSRTEVPPPTDWKKEYAACATDSERVNVIAKRLGLV